MEEVEVSSTEKLHSVDNRELLERVPLSFKKEFAAPNRNGRSAEVLDLSVAWISLNLPTEQIEEVMELAASVFENRKTAEEWLIHPNLATFEKPPLALLGTEEGFLRVKTLLHRIEYGVLA